MRPSLPAVALSLSLAACSSASPEGTGATLDGGAGGADTSIESSTDAGETGDAAEAGRDGASSAESGTSTDGGGTPADAMASDGGDGGDGGIVCIVNLVAGDCMDVSACAALVGYTSTSGLCPGPANIECCTLTPDVSTNPPVPAGWVLMMQSMVTPAMTTWAVAILNDPITYPMFSTAMMTFGTQLVTARVEWHPPDFQNSKVHRGVTLYVP